jgi:hypothetical protein
MSLGGCLGGGELALELPRAGVEVRQISVSQQIEEALVMPRSPQRLLVRTAHPTKRGRFVANAGRFAVKRAAFTAKRDGFTVICRAITMKRRRRQPGVRR